MNFCFMSHRGLVRDTNEDNCAVFAAMHDSAYIFAVCDGLGGYNAGEVASSMAVKLLKHEIQNKVTAFADATDLQRQLDDVLQNINVAIYRKSLSDQIYKDMGTTITMGFMFKDLFVTANVGDSRIYLYRDAKLQRLTEDQTYVNELVKAGTISVDDALVHPGRHIITQALGMPDYLKIDYTSQVLQPNDCILLASDGLYAVLSDLEIEESIVAAKSPEDLTNRLVKSVFAGGAPDNLTLISIFA